MRWGVCRREKCSGKLTQGAISDISRKRRMTGTFHLTGITISSYLVQTNTAGMGSLITSHKATEEETGTGSSQRKEQGLCLSHHRDLKSPAVSHTLIAIEQIQTIKKSFIICPLKSYKKGFCGLSHVR